MSVFFVDRYEDGAFDFEVGIDEVVAFEHDDLVDLCVADLSGLASVERALREDRELVLVAAPSMTEDQLRSWLVRWWADRGVEVEFEDG